MQNILDFIKIWLNITVADKILLMALTVMFLFLNFMCINWFIKISPKIKEKLKLTLKMPFLSYELENKGQEKEVTKQETKETTSTVTVNVNNAEIVQEPKDVIISKHSPLIPLVNHSFFFNLNNKMHTSMGCLNFDIDFDKEACTDEAFNNKMFITQFFLQKCKVKVFHDRLRSYVDKLVNTNGIDIMNFMNEIYLCIDEYESLARQHKIELPNKRIIYGVPENFILKFNEWHQPHVELLAAKVKDIIYNNFYQTWEIKVIVILEILDMSFELTYQDAKMTLLSINGEVEREIDEKIKACGLNR